MIPAVDHKPHTKIISLNRFSSMISNREIEVLELIAHEFTTKEIARKLFVSPHTIDSHRKKLMEKWNVKNSAGLVRVGFQSGVLV